jgi:methylthioribose-1-phosphate isomerase
MDEYQVIVWEEEQLQLLDQRRLPHEVRYNSYEDHGEVAEAIREMVVRGAPAIGITAAYGMALAARQSAAADVAGLLEDLERAGERLRAARPTAVNLSYAIDRVLERARKPALETVEAVRSALLEEAHAIYEDERRANRRIGEHSLELVPQGASIIHHCNTGALATGAYGTALGVIRAAHEAGKEIFAYVDETRPRLQGARLTTWELQRLGVPHAVIVDGASGHVMRTHGVHLCVVGADRVVANGDTANKIGTYNLALAARAHGVAFYVAAPTSTIDLATPSGDAIEIEQRPDEEVTHVGEVQITPDGTEVRNPAFDVTPASYISAIITERGVAYPPYETSLRRLVLGGE